MIKVVGIRFQRAGKIYYFDPLDYDLATAMHVIVETARGVEMGTVLIPPKEVDDDKVVQPLKPVIRIATDDDEKVIEKNKEKEAEAYVICKEKIAKHGLDMKLVAAEYTFDNNKLLFYFTADGRIDFRELVKDLASVFRTRIELRQIGVRDETKMLGGIGICGRELCCLKNEQETYEELNRNLPGIGDMVTTPQGVSGTVQSVNVLRQMVKIVVEVNDEKEIQEFPVRDLRFRPKRKKGKGGSADHEEKEVKKGDSKPNEK